MRDGLVNTAGVVLAAGSGTRLGGVAKALLRAGDRTYLRAIVETLRTVGCSDAIVVVGQPFLETVVAEARALGARTIVNPDPARGMASSIALGFAALADIPPEIEAAWLWPVDHPDVSTATLRALIAALGDHDVARPSCDGRRGHPPLIAHRAWPRLAACDRVDGGARAVLAKLDGVDVAVHDRGVVLDIDTPADVEARG